MASVFFSYSHKDEALRDRLETSLAMLKRQGFIETWYDRRIAAGDEIDNRIDEHLELADVVLLLVSPDFLASDYCYEKEMMRALERHKNGEVRVIPVILRPCQWKDAPFGRLRAIPQDGKPVTKHADLDDAFLDIANEIKSALGANPDAPGLATAAPTVPQAMIAAPPVPAGPRSSNLRTRKTFTQADKDRFEDDGFEYIAAYFENSLQELQTRSAEIETTFKRIDANAFSAVAYVDGNLRSQCRVFRGSPFGGVAYSMEANSDGRSMNNNMTIEDNEDGIAFRSLGYGSHPAGRLTFEGAAEQYWSIFMERLQR